MYNSSLFDTILYSFIYEYENISFYYQEVELAKKLREVISNSESFDIDLCIL